MARRTSSTSINHGRLLTGAGFAEEVYLGAYNTVSEARASIRQYLGFYVSRRPHSSLDRKMPH